MIITMAVLTRAGMVASCERLASQQNLIKD
jgi:hypothetical protein